MLSMNRHRLIGALLIGAMLLPSCGGLGEPVPDEPDVLLLPWTAGDVVPDVSDSNKRKAPPVTSVELLTRHFGRELDAGHRDALRRAVDDDADKLIDAEEIEAILEESGFDVFVFEAGPDDSKTGLKHHLDRGRPVLVLITPAERSEWALVVGYDDDTMLYLFRRSDVEVVGLSFETFTRLWQATDRIAILALPVEEPADVGTE